MIFTGGEDFIEAVETGGYVRVGTFRETFGKGPRRSFRPGHVADARRISFGRAPLCGQTALKAVHIHEVRRPFRMPFATSLGMKDVMRSIVVRVVLEDGSEGLGESPTSAVFPHETISVIRAGSSGGPVTLKGCPPPGE